MPINIASCSITQHPWHARARDVAFGSRSAIPLADTRSMSQLHNASIWQSLRSKSRGSSWTRWSCYHNKAGTMPCARHQVLGKTVDQDNLVNGLDYLCLPDLHKQRASLFPRCYRYLTERRKKSSTIAVPDTVLSRK
jgi:hypothetical protein